YRRVPEKMPVAASVGWTTSWLVSIGLYTSPWADAAPAVAATATAAMTSRRMTPPCPRGRPRPGPPGRLSRPVVRVRKGGEIPSAGGLSRTFRRFDPLPAGPRPRRGERGRAGGVGDPVPPHRGQPAEHRH